MMAAASAWDGLAAELTTAATGYTSVIDELTSSPWLGPASRTMMAAVAPYVSWISTAGAAAEEAATQARAAAAAFETAFTLTVPPPVVAANRVLLATLVATNFFGQNTPAIAATEAQYMEMWAQDAAAMYGYASSSALATELNQFVDPPNTTTAAAAEGQSAAVAQATAQPAGQSAQTVATSASQLIAAVPQALHQLAAAPAAITTQHGLVWNTIEDFLTYGLPTPTNNWIGLAPGQYTAIIKQTLQAYFAVGIANFGWSIGQQTFNGPLGTTAGSGGAFIPSPQFAALGAGGWHFHGAGLASSTAHLSSATRIGGLSVPSSWLNATGAPGTAGESAATKLVSANLGTPEGVNAAGTNAALRGMPMVGGGGRGAQRAGSLGVRYGFRYSVLTRPPSAG
jgi:PPE-repeat protein